MSSPPYIYHYIKLIQKLTIENRCFFDNDNKTYFLIVEYFDCVNLYFSIKTKEDWRNIKNIYVQIT